MSTTALPPSEPMALGLHYHISWWYVWLALVPYLALVKDHYATAELKPTTPVPSVSDQRLRKVAAGWNVFMAVFSAWGTWQTCDVLVQPWLLRQVPVSRYADLEWAGTLYVVSKFWELLDTVLLYVRNRPIVKLHWTHHVITLVYAVLALNRRSTGSMYFSALNYVVHTVMYAYYAGLYWFPSWRHQGQYVTLLQMAQFVVAMGYTWWWRDLFAPGTWALAWWMYAYYLYEFIQIFHHRVSSTRVQS